MPPGTAPGVPGDVADLAGEEHEPVGLDDLAERQRPGRDAGELGDGLGHRLLLRMSGRLESPAGGLHGPLGPPGQVVPGGDAGPQCDAVGGVGALPPAAQQQPDDPGEVELGVPVAEADAAPCRRPPGSGP